MLGLGLSIPEMAVRGGGAVIAATALNPADKASNAVLSNSNRTLASNSAAQRAGARTVHSIAANQKAYWETVINAFDNSILIGVSDNTFSLTGVIGSDSPSHSFRVGTGTTTYSNVDSVSNGSVAFPSSPGLGDNIGIAFDTSSLKVWFRLNGGNWNNAAIGSQNPATGTGGFAVTFTGGLAFFPFDSVGDTGDQITANFASGSWAFAAPNGFSQIV